MEVPQKTQDGAVFGFTINLISTSKTDPRAPVKGFIVTKAWWGASQLFAACHWHRASARWQRKNRPEPFQRLGRAWHDAGTRKRLKPFRSVRPSGTRLKPGVDERKKSPCQKLECARRCGQFSGFHRASRFCLSITSSIAQPPMTPKPA